MDKVTEQQSGRLGALNEMGDVELVHIVRQQLPYVTHAYEVLMRRYQKLLFKTCNRYLNSKEDSEDVTHEIMLKVFHNINSFREDSSFKTWLFRIAHNQAMDLLRKRKKLQDYESGVSFDEELSPESFISEMPEFNQDYLSSLNITDRSIVIFRIVSDLEFKEIADIVGLKLSAVKMRYQRALEKLKALHSL